MGLCSGILHEILARFNPELKLASPEGHENHEPWDQHGTSDFITLSVDENTS